MQPAIVYYVYDMIVTLTFWANVIQNVVVLKITINHAVGGGTIYLNHD